VLVLGSPAEHDLADLIVAAMTRPAVDLTTARMGLATLKGVVRRLDLMITNDTGPRHLATALGVPAVCIFGPTHRTWGDCGDRRTIELQLEMDCGPRMQRRCPLEHHRCMADLTPQMVVGAATKVLATRRLSGPTPLPR
jgi:heptosyltransferase-2